MVLWCWGKRYDPASDESYKAILGLETRAAASEKKVLEITEELNDIERGHLDKNLHQEASKSLQKRVKSVNEELQKLLEGLDSIQLAEDQLGEIFIFFFNIFYFKTHSDAKVKRKSIATKINQVMDKNDLNLEKVKIVFENK